MVESFHAELDFFLNQVFSEMRDEPGAEGVPSFTSVFGITAPLIETSADRGTKKLQRVQ